jgi:hypothetical protein
MREDLSRRGEESVVHGSRGAVLDAYSGIGNSTHCATYSRATSDCPRAGPGHKDRIWSCLSRCVRGSLLSMKFRDLTRLPFKRPARPEKVRRIFASSEPRRRDTCNSKHEETE